MGASLLIATLLLALPSRADDGRWRQDESCGQRQSAMAPVKDKACYRAWCSTTELGRLCACVKEDTDDTHFALERVTGARQTWKAPLVPPLGGDASHFRIDRVGDGRLFFGVMAGESVGIAVSNWTVWAIDREGLSKPLEVQNYGTLSYATMARPGASCYLLAARWHSGWEPGRGHGMYIAGSWYAVESGAFVRVLDRPVVYVRYLSGVERARYDAEGRDQPLLWYRHPGVKRAIGPPPLTGREPGK
ncbi:MAG TPA: hypothetical protein VFO71_11635 [Gemmatimonadales bacterium]|nr:hypothetical protein [Gemmatimonadales bacterium]